MLLFGQAEYNQAENKLNNVIKVLGTWFEKFEN
jgi:hypothetical protein